MTAPGAPGPDHAPDLADAERLARGWAVDHTPELRPLLAEYDRRGAELEHARPVVSAARELVEHLRNPKRLVHDADLRVRLSILAARVAALPDTTETED